MTFIFIFLFEIKKRFVSDYNTDQRRFRNRDIIPLKINFNMNHKLCAYNIEYRKSLSHRTHFVEEINIFDLNFVFYQPLIDMQKP